jgi:hypothetical protein
MLKPTEPANDPQSERPVGELVQQLVDDGKAYARAEFEVAKAVAGEKARALVWPSGLFLAALIVLQSAVTVLAVAVFFALTLVMNPVIAGLIATLIFAAIAGGLAWYGVERLKRDL